MANRHKDKELVPGCKAEVERLEKAQARDRRYAAPSVRVGARGTRTAPRRGYKAETRVSQSFRQPKAGPKLGPVAQANLDARIGAAIFKVEADIQAESVAAARVAAIPVVPFHSTVRERIAQACNLA